MNILARFNIPETRKTAIAALFIAAFLWSTAGIAFRLLTVSHGVAISGYRSLFAALFYIVAFRSLPKMEGTRWFKVAILAHCGATTLFVVANTLTTAANSILLQFTASPIFACIFLFFIFKKPLPKHDIIATVLIFVGICIFFLDSLTLQMSPSMSLGNAIAVGAGAAFGLQAIVLKHTKMPRNAFTFANGLNVLIALPFIILNPIGSLLDLALLAYLGVVQIGLSYLLFSFAVRKVAPLELILIPALEPILNPIWVVIFDGQMPSLLSVLGGLMIFVTVLAWSIYKEVYYRKQKLE